MTARLIRMLNADSSRSTDTIVVSDKRSGPGPDFVAVRAAVRDDVRVIASGTVSQCAGSRAVWRW